MNHKDTVITKVQGLPLWNLERRPDCSEQWGFLFLMQAFSWGAKINHEFYTHGKHCWKQSHCLRKVSVSGRITNSMENKDEKKIVGSTTLLFFMWIFFSTLGPNISYNGLKNWFRSEMCHIRSSHISLLITAFLPLRNPLHVLSYGFASTKMFWKHSSSFMFSQYQEGFVYQRLTASLNFVVIGSLVSSFFVF